MPVSKSNQINEIIKCGKDPVHFTNKYLKIAHAEKGLIGFDTYSFQDDCLNSFVDHRFNIVLKSRQLGLSTITAAFAIWRAIFYKEKNILVIATKLAVAQNFVKKVKVMLANMPSWLLIPSVTSSTKTTIEFSNGSKIHAIPTSDDAGRSEALSLLIIDEAAFIRNFEELWTGLYPTVSTGGSVIILSTPNGVGNQYHRLWADAEEGLSDFNPIKLPWYVHPERDDEWFAKETRQMKKKAIAQELLCDFTSSGDTFLTAEDLDKIRIGCRPPIEMSGPSNGIWIWKYPIVGKTYVLSADIARGDAADFSTFEIFCVEDSEQVCEFKGKIPPDQFGHLIYDIANRYNEALVCPENNTYGFATITKLKELGYPNLYINDKKFSYSLDVPIGKIGFNTNSSTRGPILTNLEIYLRNSSIKINSNRLVDELRTFIWSGNTPKAQKGYNDDLVMATAIVCNLFDPNGKSEGPTTNIYQAMLNATANINRQTNNKVIPYSMQNNPLNPLGYSPKGIHSGEIDPQFAWLYK
jgi:hypothetical protein